MEAKRSKKKSKKRNWAKLKAEYCTTDVVVVARKHIVRFAKNNRIVNPFNYGSFINDPETGRGISLLYCVLPLAELQENLMNRTCDMQTLQENPPIYAPKGFFDDDEIKLYPGKIIEFGDNLSV